MSEASPFFVDLWAPTRLQSLRSIWKGNFEDPRPSNSINTHQITINAPSVTTRAVLCPFRSGRCFCWSPESSRGRCLLPRMVCPSAKWRRTSTVPSVTGSMGWPHTCSMYGIFTNICPKNHPNVGKYSSTMEHMGYWTTHFWTESKPQFTIAWVSMSRLKEFQGYRLWEVIILNIVVQLYMSPSQSRMSNRGCWIQHSDRVFISGVILGGSLLSFRKAFHLSWLWPVQKLPIYRLMM